MTSISFYSESDDPEVLPSLGANVALLYLLSYLPGELGCGLH